MSPVAEAYSVGHPFYLLYKAAEVSLAHAAKVPEHRSLHLINAYVMTAFTLEAYVNDFCAVSLPKSLWSDVERKLSTSDKLKLAAACLPITIDFSKQPFQQVSSIFRIRDLIAHSKRRVRTVAHEDLNAAVLQMPEDELRTILSDSELAAKLYRAVFEMISYLHEARSTKDGDGHPLASGPVSNFITIVLEDEKKSASE